MNQTNKIKFYWLHYLFLTIFFFEFCSCNQRTNDNAYRKNSKCNFNQKIEELTQILLKKEYIYDEINFGKETVLIANNLVKPNNIYWKNDSVRIKTVYEDSIRDNSHNKIYFSNINLSKDSSLIELKVDYFASVEKYPIPPKNFLTRESRFKFLLDEKSCNWVLIDSSSDYAR
ncbi:hypothetical protein BH10BAC5_BH10BAC5_24980 [soil metagenome]